MSRSSAMVTLRTSCEVGYALSSAVSCASCACAAPAAPAAARSISAATAPVVGSGVRQRDGLPARVLVAVAVTIVMAILMFSVTLSSVAPAATETTTPVVVAKGPSVADAEIADGVESWVSLSRGSRLGLLRKVAEREAAVLHLPAVPTVSPGDLPDVMLGNCRGYEITLNEELIEDDDSGWRLVNTTAHECRHAYQHAAVNGELGDGAACPSNQTVEAWRLEFADYQCADGANGFERYQEQEVEQDARRYARDAVLRIRDGSAYETGSR